MLERIEISPNGEFINADGDSVQLRGVNFDANVKFPKLPHLPTNIPVEESFWDDAAGVSFITHPLDPVDVVEHVKRLKSLGYNCIRYCFTWEALEHSGPGVYDEGYMEHTVEILKKIHEVGGIYVYLDPHQDVWSRFSGGSGAPLWTLHCAGLQPKRFQKTEAAILHNFYVDSENECGIHGYPKMVWSTNYYRLACQTMFTLFFSGKEFAPKCRINGVNIQDYLQDKFVTAIMTFYRYIKSRAPELFKENCVIGLESINEPSCGYVGVSNLGKLDGKHNLRKGHTPTAFQSFQLGEGIASTVDCYEITIFGPKKTGKIYVDPQGTSAWLSGDERQSIDAKYGWQRDDEWLPTCVWRLHGVWRYDRTHNKKPVLSKPYYFSTLPTTGEPVDMTYFTNTCFVQFFAKYRAAFREVDEEGLLFMEPPVLQEPPKLSGTELIDKRTVYACHYYDGMSLLFNTWNKRYNIDTFGVMRGRYINPIFGIVFGETNIRKCIRSQLKQMILEGKKFLGSHVPVFFTEIGMPYDMDNKKAYKDGDFTSQIRANDALGFALEGNNVSFSLWCYCRENNHKWGDNWNNEDFSIWSVDDVISDAKENYSQANSESAVSTLVAGTSSIKASENLNDLGETAIFDYSGFRALDSILRPFPLKIHGTFKYSEFDLENSRYLLEINAKEQLGYTTVFLPYYHFPADSITLSVSSGYTIREVEKQTIKWFHDKGNQYLAVEARIMDRSSRKKTVIVAVPNVIVTSYVLR